MILHSAASSYQGDASPDWLTGWCAAHLGHVLPATRDRQIIVGDHSVSDMLLTLASVWGRLERCRQPNWWLSGVLLTWCVVAGPQHRPQCCCRAQPSAPTDQADSRRLAACPAHLSASFIAGPAAPHVWPQAGALWGQQQVSRLSACTVCIPPRLCCSTALTFAVPWWPIQVLPQAKAGMLGHTTKASTGPLQCIMSSQRQLPTRQLSTMLRLPAGRLCVECCRESDALLQGGAVAGLSYSA